MLPMSAILNVMTWWPSWIKVIYKVLYWWVQVMKCMTFHNLSFTFVLSIYKLNLSNKYKTDHHDITEILLKVALNTMMQKKQQQHLAKPPKSHF
jgi:hypothetical protein